MGLSGILTIGGTILGTSRDKPHKMPVGDRIMDMTDVMIDVFKKNTILGHVQRGGTPTAADRLLATRLGTACTEFIQKDLYGRMIAMKNHQVEGIPLEKIIGQVKWVPADHSWIESARLVGTSFGD